MISKRMALVSAGAAAVLATGGTAAAAVISGPVDGNGIVHGCYISPAIKGSHVIVLQDAGTTARTAQPQSPGISRGLQGLRVLRVLRGQQAPRDRQVLRARPARMALRDLLARRDRPEPPGGSMP